MVLGEKHGTNYLPCTIFQIAHGFTILLNLIFEEYQILHLRINCRKSHILRFLYLSRSFSNNLISTLTCIIYIHHSATELVDILYNRGLTRTKTLLCNVSAKYCYVTRKLRLHQNDRCKRFTLF